MPDEDDINFNPASLEGIDWAMYQWVDDTIDAHATTNDGWRKVPVLWKSAERVWQIKGDREIRDEDGALVFPLIAIERTGKTKSLTEKGSIFAHLPPAINDEKEGSIAWIHQINHKKTADFKNADSMEDHGDINFKTSENEDERKRNTVIESTYIQQPSYITNNYEITLRADFQQQMNQMVTPFLNEVGNINHFATRYEGHFYEGFIQEDISQDNNVSNFNEEERIFKNTVSIDMLGYITKSDNEDKPQTVKRESPAQVAIEENVMTGSLDNF